MKCKLVISIQAGRYNDYPYREWMPVGHVINLPGCFRLVQNGCAVPADEECEKRVNLSAEQMADLQLRYKAIDAGIAPEDRIAFFDGEIEGYHGDGSPIPGPNAELDDEEDEDDE